jgi:hypothetical protein
MQKYRCAVRLRSIWRVKDDWLKRRWRSALRAPCSPDAAWRTAPQWVATSPKSKQ